MLDFLKNNGIINLVHDFGELCNGSTTDSDSVCWGSNPYSTATAPKLDSHGVTGGVYKTRERIHRGILIRDY